MHENTNPMRSGCCFLFGVKRMRWMPISRSGYCGISKPLNPPLRLSYLIPFVFSPRTTYVYNAPAPEAAEPLDQASQVV